MGSHETEMINTEVKGTLARLLATENLKVEHRKVSTACFDVHNRVLILPIWKRASATVYDLLVGHEVGHALYTPDEDYDAPKDFVNVLEDARIEKLMRRSYPGLKKTFYQGYKELWESDFFSIKDEEIANLPFIDRINIYYKGNPEVPFSDTEMDYVKRAGDTNTFVEVVSLAKEVYEFSKKKQEEKELDAPVSSKKGAPQPGGSNGDMTEETKEWPTESDPETDHRADRSTEKADLDTPSYEGGDVGGEHNELESITDAALQQAMQDLVDDDAKEWVYLDLPKVKLQDYVVSYKTIYDNYTSFFADLEIPAAEQLYFTYSKCDEYKKSAQKSVNYLVKQFEMKKSADQYARANTSSTGVINTNKLHNYKISEDIFKKITVVPDGKNHGLIMLLDWSGSMQNVLMDILKQTYNLIWFCKKVGIPFRVYAFQGGVGTHQEETNKASYERNTLAIHNDFRLLEFFSSQMNISMLDKQMKYIWAQAWSMIAYTRHGAIGQYGLGGTPLAESVMLMREAVAQLQRKDNVSKVNVVCLTDGEANPMSYVSGHYDERSYRCGDPILDYLCHNRNKVFILRDPATGYSRKISGSPYETTKEIVSFYREITDYNWIGIRLCSKNEVVRFIQNNSPNQLDKLSKQWTKEKFCSLENVGFSKTFFMPNQHIGGSTQDLEIKQKGEVATKGELTRAFKKHMGSKMTNKTILNAFIEQIA
ncbi:gp150 [Synechococcus phage syn9]|uniref:Gp150 n=1 Tax=Synechococcus phage syn9 TaxID=382359 RepID=Q0QZ75_BPSYS|nr:peptidase [Synechococcus phage syn9]ABA47121.1 gp150 [Synechococcus phage syn9]